MKKTMSIEDDRWVEKKEKVVISPVKRGRSRHRVKFFLVSGPLRRENNHKIKNEIPQENA